MAAFAPDEALTSKELRRRCQLSNGKLNHLLAHAIEMRLLTRSVITVKSLMRYQYRLPQL